MIGLFSLKIELKKHSPHMQTNSVGKRQPGPCTLDAWSAILQQASKHVQCGLIFWHFAKRFIFWRFAKAGNHYYLRRYRVDPHQLHYNPLLSKQYRKFKLSAGYLYVKLISTIYTVKKG